MLYHDVKDLSKLSEEQKQTVSALAMISAGRAGGGQYGVCGSRGADREECGGV